MSQEQVAQEVIVGLDAASVGSRKGWAMVAVALADRGLGPIVGLGFTQDLRPLLSGRIPGLADLAARVVGVGVDIPIGLMGSGLRAADVEGRRALGPRSATLFPIAPRPALELDDYDQAKSEAQRLIGQKISKQSYGLRARILEVEALVRAAEPGSPPWFEVHPELTFAALAGEVVLESKTTPEGLTRREELLAAAELVPGWGAATTELAQRVGRDDMLDAAAAAWSAHRALSGKAVRYGEGLRQWDPELGREILIFA